MHHLRYIAYALLLPARVYHINVIMSIQSGGVDIDEQGDLKCRQLKMDHSMIISRVSVRNMRGICEEYAVNWCAAEPTMSLCEHGMCS